MTGTHKALFSFSGTNGLRITKAHQTLHPIFIGDKLRPGERRGLAQPGGSFVNALNGSQ